MVNFSQFFLINMYTTGEINEQGLSFLQIIMAHNASEHRDIPFETLLIIE